MMKRVAINFISCIAFILMLLGGCSIVDEYGNLQPFALIASIVSALVILFIAKGDER